MGVAGEEDGVPADASKQDDAAQVGDSAVPPGAAAKRAQASLLGDPILPFCLQFEDSRPRRRKYAQLEAAPEGHSRPRGHELLRKADIDRHAQRPCPTCKIASLADA